MQLDQKKIKQFQKEILDWYAVHQRDLPWRKSRDPYKILVSEVMLQQTQVNRVIPKYEAWLKAFPDVESLAKAKKEEVLRLWSGLGYNRRALSLQRCAQAILELKIKNEKVKMKVQSKNDQAQQKLVILNEVKNPRLPKPGYGGQVSRMRVPIFMGDSWSPPRTSSSAKPQDDNDYWPKTVEELEKLPGIGPYTARAVACFAFDQQVAVVDTNVRKVILVKLLGKNSQILSDKQSRIKNHELRIKNKKTKIHDSLFLIHDPTLVSENVSEKEIAAIAQQILPIGLAYEWNQALMDYSSAVLQKERVSIRKQSKFKDSNRYYRGKLVRLLLEQKEIAAEKVGFLLRDDFSDKDEEWKEKLLSDMTKDGLVIVDKKKVRLE